jgi:hypothetical protein
VTLNAVPDTGATFVQWTGACNGQAATCTLTPKDTITTNAVFGLASKTTSTATSTTPTSTTPTSTTPTTTTPTTTTSTAAKQTLTAHVVYATVLPNKQGKLSLQLRLRVPEPVTGRLQLVGKHGTIMTAQSFKLSAGAHTVNAFISAATPSGIAHLTVTLTDSAKHHDTLKATVVVPH